MLTLGIVQPVMVSYALSLVSVLYSRCFFGSMPTIFFYLRFNSSIASSSVFQLYGSSDNIMTILL